MITRRNLFLGSAAIILTPGVLMPVRRIVELRDFILPFNIPTDPELAMLVRYTEHAIAERMTLTREMMLHGALMHRSSASSLLMSSTGGELVTIGRIENDRIVGVGRFA